MSDDLLEPLCVSLQVALAALACVLPPGFILALILARGPKRGRVLLEAIVMLPLVLPPVAIGALLLTIFGRRGLGPALNAMGFELLATQRGAALAAALVALPIFVRAARSAIEAVDPRLEEMAALLGAAPLRVIATVTLPLARRGLIGAALLAFGRALSEFGATILVAGSIPGYTQTLPSAIYEAAAGRDPNLVLQLCALSATLGFCSVWIAARIEPHTRAGR